ncbi:hypothetical protein MmiEs2_12540 [Methanimicrococcus stummii]|uniref:Uncharacterized protein n=1 Tax=Methanimicrococcus stummii TaxID=3028294 RepID=A0AA96VB40_9EURY|nr:hypothetical protein [Methanimicrococcus sp. Es2]WNY29040.1 hypothetical protein MmiEs2_12540 [Methanimicrococcus sp. Es2]
MEISQEKLLRYLGIGQILAALLFFVYFEHLGYNVSFSELMIAGTCFAIGIEKTVLPNYWNKLFLALSAFFYIYAVATTFLNFGILIDRYVGLVSVLLVVVLSFVYLYVRHKAEKKAGIKKTPEFKNF